MPSKSTKFQPLPTSDAATKVAETDPDYLCGIFNYRPRWMQRFARTQYFLVCYIVYGVFQGALKAYLNGCITTIERKFALTGKMFSVILIADNVSSLFASLLIGYYARKVSRPRMITFSVSMSVLGCVLAALPYFIYGPGFIGDFQGQPALQGEEEAYQAIGDSRKEFCSRTDSNEASVARDQSPAASAIHAVCILFLANFLNGFGGAAFYISGTTYTDDNAKKTDSIVYFSFVFSLRFLGPMLGYVMASVCLRIYESPFETPSITAKHPKWIGAWWLGFILWGVSLVIISLPMSLFPKHIRRQSRSLEKQEMQKVSSSELATDTFREKVAGDFAEFRRSFARLCKNPVLMWKIATIMFVYNGTGGYITMFPKYVEIHYRVSASNASLFTGPTKILAMMLGVFLGGLMIRFLKPKARTIALMEAASDLIEISFLIAGMSLSCSGWQLAGTSMSTSNSLSIINDCNKDCGCTGSSFQPVCHVLEKATYFSPCAAGCSEDGNVTMHCSCLMNNSTTEDAVVTDGFCEFGCDSLFILVALTSVSKLLAQLPRVGGVIVSFRCVDPADKGLAVGMMGAAFNLLAAVPYPLIYSALFDATCIAWDERGGRRGNCSFYDADKLRVVFHGVTIAFLSLGLLSNLMVSYYSKRVTNLYGEADARAEETAAAATVWDDNCLRMVELDEDAMRKMTAEGEKPAQQQVRC
ncbi:solute carrier organic anion transporter family member 74D-like isoform X1 [Dermacentor albipictus]|uniref:solute carrier organic anion transporter family member 74D-like isoform X1 n=1 Tax=Dermacentor albipictus TaxID=60249 RepID=UPI0031FE320E